MNGYVDNIEQLTLENENFRKVLYTDARLQLVVMCLQAGEEIGEEVHGVDQFFRIEEGTGVAYLDGVAHPIQDGTTIIVPGGVKHNVVNTSKDESLKLYTLYVPPEHKDGTIHVTKAEADAAEEHFDGKTTE